MADDDGAGTDEVIDLTVGALLEPRDDPEPELAVLLPPTNPGVPGAAARREFGRHQAERQERLGADGGSGTGGSMAMFRSDGLLPDGLRSDGTPSTAIRAGCRYGADGERVATVLAERLGDRAVLLHGRTVPGTRGDIDHLAVAATGVWVIDVEHSTGAVEQRDVGGFFRTELRLYVGGRDRTKAVDGLAWQLGAVVTAVGDASVPVHGALGVVGADRGGADGPFRMDGIWIAGPSELADLIDGPGPLAAGDVERIARHLSVALPAR